MQHKKLRIVKQIEGVPVLGVCEWCNKQFPAAPHRLGDLSRAQDSIEEQFRDHDCRPIDSSQNTLRIVREGTEGK